MEVACNYLLDKLQTADPSSLLDIQARHRSRDDDFDLVETLEFLPSRQYLQFASALRGAIQPSLSNIRDSGTPAKSTEPPDDCTRATEDIAVARAASEIVWMFVHKRKEPPLPALRDVIVDLHSVLLKLPSGQAQNQVAKICEWLWQVNDPERDQVVAETMLCLLVRSFGREADAAPGLKSTRSGGSTADVHRVYAMRMALDCLELSEEVLEAATIRNLLLRCVTSSAYLRAESGRKFLAHLLTLEDIREALFDALLLQIASARKTWAASYGKVLVIAWKLERSGWHSTAMRNLGEKAILAGTEPMASNFRTVLSTFHTNKRVLGVDALLNSVYGPILYKNLMVANAAVRRNAVTILAEAFPIHDPDAKLQDIEHSIAFQCNKLQDLLEDPSPIVRRATVEGVGRVLGLLWELVPLASAKKMIGTLTSRLAFDASSAQVRIAVFEALKFVSQNHLSHQHLAVALPRLKCFIHDNVERVRLSFLNLLLTLKEKRLRVLRYFDIVPLEDLLLRLPLESPAAATKIMNLVLSTYFPLEKKGKTSEEIASSQVRACLSMLQACKDAVPFFYQNVNMHVPPGPLCEFAMRISALALETPIADVHAHGQYRNEGRGSSEREKRGSRKKLIDENDDPHISMCSRGDNLEKQRHVGKWRPDREALLTIVADVLTSVFPSLTKDANRQLKDYIDDVFGGDALKPLLVERGNTFASRAMCWRIGSCISPTNVGSLKDLWEEQLTSVLEWARGSVDACREYQLLLTALLICGIRWNMLGSLSNAVAGWVDVGKSGRRTCHLGAKNSKRARAGGAKRRSRPVARSSRSTSLVTGDALFALRSCAAGIIETSELKEMFVDGLAQVPPDTSAPRGYSQSLVLILRSIRKGAISCIESAIENWESCMASPEAAELKNLLDGLSMAWKLSLICFTDFGSFSDLGTEVKDMIQWASGSEVLRSAVAADQSFALSLWSLNLNYCADVAALEGLNEEDMGHLVCIASNLASSVDLCERRVLARPVVELLRITYHLLQLALPESKGADDEGESKEAIVISAASVFSTIMNILGRCRKHGQSTGCHASLTVVDEFMKDVVITLTESENIDQLQEVFGEALRRTFENADDAEHNLFAFTICNVQRAVATGARGGKGSVAPKVLSAIISAMRAQGDQPVSNRAVANFIYFVLNSILAFYAETNKSPDEDSRHFFAAVDVAVGDHFANLIDNRGNDEALDQTLADTESALAQLKQLCITEVPLSSGPELALDVKESAGEEEPA